MLGAGEVVDGVLDVIAQDTAPTVVKLEPDKVNRLLGTEISESEMRRILLSLGFELDGDEIHVPSWRADVEHYSDIAEEVARFYGYNRIPSTLSAGVNPRRGFSPVQKAENTIGALCRTAGYNEIITYSFISPTYYDKIHLPANSPLRNSLRILNPLGGHFHHADDHAALYAGDSDPELQLPKQVRQALRAGPHLLRKARRPR